MNWYTPTTMEGFAEALADCGARGQVVAGGTDLTIRLRQGKSEPEALIWPGQIPALHELALTEDSVRIGAMVTMSELARTLASVPELAAIADAAGGVGSPQIRSKATMAGNLCNASPAGDMLPIGKLYDMRVEVLSGDGSLSEIPVDEFLLGPGKTALGQGQAVVALRAERNAGFVSAFRKIGFRSHVSIARIGMAALLRFDANGAVEQARITLGAVANVPIRVPEAETLLMGRTVDQTLGEELTAVISRTVHDNCRPANRLYKTEAARGLCADLIARIEQRRQ